MKGFFTRAFDAVTLGPVRRRIGSTLTNPHDTTDQQSVNTCATSYTDHPDSDWTVYAKTPSQEVMESFEDDVLFCKNNVYLKYPSRRPKSPCGESPSTGESNGSINSGSSGVTEPTGHSIPLKPLLSEPTGDRDGVVLVPGYFHISTRGSEFGQALVLNWSPNELMSKNGSSSSWGAASGGRSSAWDKPSCSSLSIDLSQMESIRVFYQKDQSGTITGCGEVVIYTRERRYRVFIFQHGGLGDLIKKFCSWKYFNFDHQPHAFQYLFTVFRPRLSLAELHPEEALVNGVLTEEIWSQLKDHRGRVENKRLVLQTVFFRGLHPLLRSEVWPHLLGLMDFELTLNQKKERRKQNIDIYRQINSKREQLESSEHKISRSKMQQIVNDINRTDRSHPFYRGDGNPNLDRLQQILLNYLLVYRSDISYCQGMTDLLSPLLFALDDDVEAFFCFTCVVEKSPFFKPAKNRVSLKRQLSLLVALVELLLPWFFSYLKETEDGLTFVFAHRWLLVCMKREFRLEDILTMWETCWTNYSTNSFHFFICVAVIAMYGQRALDQEMTLNELTVHFSSLSNSLPVDIVLSQARGYLHQFIKCREVPCVLRSIMPDDFWNHPRSPTLVCQGSGMCCKGGPRDSMVNVT